MWIINSRCARQRPAVNSCLWLKNCRDEKTCSREHKISDNETCAFALLMFANKKNSIHLHFSYITCSRQQGFFLTKMWAKKMRWFVWQRLHSGFLVCWLNRCIFDLSLIGHVWLECGCFSVCQSFKAQHHDFNLYLPHVFHLKSFFY